jgi:hypothetical protein
MSDLGFYNAGCDEPQGVRRLVVPLRRLIRRILRPIFQRQVELFQSLCDRIDVADCNDQSLRSELANLANRHDDLADQMQSTIAFGWDYVALTRRLAILEDRVEALMARNEGQDAALGRPSVPAFPDDAPRAQAS